MNCAKCGEVLTGDIKFCPSCGTPVPQEEKKTTADYEAALEAAAVDQTAELPAAEPESSAEEKTTAEYEAALESAAADKTTADYETELETAVSEAAPPPEGKKTSKRRFRIPVWPFVTILLLAGVYQLSSSMWNKMTAPAPVVQGAVSCTALAENYLDALADAGESGRLEALLACALPAAEGDDYWTITDAGKAPVGKTALSVTLGQITFSDLTSHAADAAALEKFSGREVEEVLQVPVTVFYTDGGSADFTMEAVQLEEGYYLLAVK